MNNDSISKEQQDLINELRSRFLLFERIVGRFGSDAEAERIPWYLGLLLSAAMNPDPGACCFVLNKSPATSATVATLLALIKLQSEFPKLVVDYAKNYFQLRQRVKINPNGYVYEYAGIWDEYQDSRIFKLKILDEENYRSFPINDILRIEPTQKKTPKGKQTSHLGEFVRSPLDRILGLSTGGNTSLIKNQVFMLMPRAAFGRIIDEIAMATEKSTDFCKLSDILPWGSIGVGGSLKPNETHQIVGEPVLALTRVPEDLASAVSSVKSGTKSILVDGARALTRNLQAFDDIVEQQRVVILASPDELDELTSLKEQGCQIWHISPSEILLGESKVKDRQRRSFVGLPVRSAHMRRHAKVTLIPCQDDEIQNAAMSLNFIANTIDSGDETHEVEEILARLFQVLCDCSECCFGVGEHTKQNLQTASSKLKQSEQWLKTDIADYFCKVIYELENISKSEEYRSEKASAFFDQIPVSNHEQCIVIARSPKNIDNLQTVLHECNINVSIRTLPALTQDKEYSRIIVPAWLNRKNFTLLKNRAVSSDIRILTYPHELEWLTQHKMHQRAQYRESHIGIETRSEILGIKPHLLNCLYTSPLNDESTAEPPVVRIYDRVLKRYTNAPTVHKNSEDHREAQRVQFVGDCYTLQTEYANLFKLNQLIDSPDCMDAKLTIEKSSELCRGDLTLFRTSGNKEFTRLIAEDDLGIEKYKRVRQTAELWKTTLHKLGSNSQEVQQRLKLNGIDRSIVTIRAWLYDCDRIGPNNFSDIKYIAVAAGDDEFLRRVEEVKTAIQLIRGAHISAGNQLTKYILDDMREKLTYFDGQPTFIDFEFGEAWIVQVEEIDPERRKYPANRVNRLLWSDAFEF